MRTEQACVIIADQVDSRHAEDAVPAALAALAHVPTLLPFERTAGDEIQGLPSSPEAAIEAIEILARARNWTIGLGVGDVEQPLPESTRAARGSAYVAAREALEESRAGSRRVQVRASAAESEQLAHDAETVLLLLEPLIRERTDAAWEAIDLAAGRTQQQVAEELGISQGSVSRRLAGAHLELTERAATLAAGLLGQAVGLAS